MPQKHKVSIEETKRGSTLFWHQVQALSSEIGHFTSEVYCLGQLGVVVFAHVLSLKVNWKPLRVEQCFSYFYPSYYPS